MPTTALKFNLLGVVVGVRAYFCGARVVSGHVVVVFVIHGLMHHGRLLVECLGCADYLHGGALMNV